MSRRKVEPHTAKPDLPAWQLQDAKARFSELVRAARKDGPQMVTVRGEEAVIVMSPAEYARLKPPVPEISLWEAFARMPACHPDEFEIEIVREEEVWREPESFE